MLRPDQGPRMPRRARTPVRDGQREAARIVARPDRNGRPKPQTFRAHHFHSHAIVSRGRVISTISARDNATAFRALHPDAWGWDCTESDGRVTLWQPIGEAPSARASRSAVPAVDVRKAQRRVRDRLTGGFASGMVRNVG